MRSYPGLRGKLLGSEEEVDVFDGLREVLREIPDVDSIGGYTSTCIQKGRG